MPTVIAQPGRSARFGAGWRYVDELVFLAVFGYLFYGLVSGLVQYLWATGGGGGLFGDLIGPLKDGQYYKIILAIIWLLIPVLTLWEIALFVGMALRRERATPWGVRKLRWLLGGLAREYKPTFMAALVGELLTRVIVIDMFWHWLPAFQRLSRFSIGVHWYTWLYALLAWELSTWVWHFGAHKIRLFWCLHAPHHAAQQFNMTVAWVHFFAEGYVTATIQLIILMVLCVPPPMLVVIMAFEPAWGTFIHAGERSLRTGRLGFLRYGLITPSYHRVHHAKNALYLDTNFCTLLPFWDWLFGTLQPLRDEVRIEYGTTRRMDPTRFLDFYFGEFVVLMGDLRRARSWGERLRYLLKPPGWTPGDGRHTATLTRREFLKTHPQLALPRGRDVLSRLLSRLGPAAAGPAS